MEQELFEKLVAEEFEQAIPERFVAHIHNVAFLVEDEPSEDVRRAEALGPGDSLLGLYRGVSLDRRGSDYGLGATMPDTITLYRLPILAEAAEQGGGEEAVRRVLRETIWHEVAHYFGFDEHAVEQREDEGRNFSV